MKAQPKERPILFNDAHVRAILDGKKTQTRRVVDLQPHSIDDVKYHDNGMPFIRNQDVICECQFGKPGGTLWVRETWAYHIHAMQTNSSWLSGPWVYAADGDSARQNRLCEFWRKPTHMPRQASRITLEITGVRVERLQDISEADAMAEGCNKPISICEDDDCSRRADFERLWESINGHGSWDENPWVWAIEFDVVEVKA